MAGSTDSPVTGAATNFDALSSHLPNNYIHYVHSLYRPLIHIFSHIHLCFIHMKSFYM